MKNLSMSVLVVLITVIFTGCATKMNVTEGNGPNGYQKTDKSWSLSPFFGTGSSAGGGYVGRSAPVVGGYGYSRDYGSRYDYSRGSYGGYHNPYGSPIGGQYRYPPPTQHPTPYGGYQGGGRYHY